MFNTWGPLQAHAASSFEQWKAIAQGYLDNQNVSRFARGLPTLTLTVSLVPPRLSPRLEWNQWKVACSKCGNWPSYSPEWQAAICFECGNIYQNVAIDGDPSAIDTTMGRVSAIPDRNWSPGDDLTALLDTVVVSPIASVDSEGPV